MIADYSQIELRIVAEISHDIRMVDAYQKGEDLNVVTAGLVTGESIANVANNKNSLAKAVNYGAIYTTGAEELVEYSRDNYHVTMTLEKAEKFRNRFLSVYQGVAQWQQGVEFDSYCATRTLGNRRRLWGGYYANNTEYLKTPIQGSSSDIVKKALSILHERIQGSGIRIISCIHDEIITEAPLAKTETAAQIVRDSMIDAGKVYLKDVPVVVDVFIVDNWYEKIPGRS